MRDDVITTNSQVLMHIIIRLDDGSIAENTRRTGRPSLVRLGDQSISQVFESHLLGLAVGDKKEFRLTPNDAFGENSSSNYMTFPLSQFSADMEIEPGVIIEFENKNGTEMLGVIQSIEEDKVIVDFNHPLAGHPVQFEIEILQIN